MIFLAVAIVVSATVYGVLVARTARYMIAQHMERLDRLDAAKHEARIVELEKRVSSLVTERLGRR